MVRHETWTASREEEIAELAALEEQVTDTQTPEEMRKAALRPREHAEESRRRHLGYRHDDSS